MWKKRRRYRHYGIQYNFVRIFSQFSDSIIITKHNENRKRNEARQKLRGEFDDSLVASLERVVSIAIQFIIIIIHSMGFLFSVNDNIFLFITFHTKRCSSLVRLCLSFFFFVFFFFALVTLFICTFYLKYRFTSVCFYQRDRAARARTRFFIQVNVFFADRIVSANEWNSESQRRRKILHLLRSNDPNWLYIHCVAAMQPEHIAAVGMYQKCYVCCLCFTLRRCERDEIKTNE